MVAITPPADDTAAAAERAVVIAEARILVRRLAVYTDLVAQWFAEGGPDHADE